MPISESQFSATAGEHFVAYRIASLGLIPAVVRQAVRSFDLLVTSPDGSRSAGVVVKTALHARRTTPGRREVLDFPFSPRSVEKMAASSFYCFVDLQTEDAGAIPAVFVVPMTILKAEYPAVRSPKYLQSRYSRPVEFMDPFRNNWEPLVAAMRGKQFALRTAPRIQSVTRLSLKLGETIECASLTDRPTVQPHWTDPLSAAAVPPVAV